MLLKLTLILIACCCLVGARAEDDELTSQPEARVDPVFELEMVNGTEGSSTTLTAATTLNHTSPDTTKPGKANTAPIIFTFVLVVVIALLGFLVYYLFCNRRSDNDTRDLTIVHTTISLPVSTPSSQQYASENDNTASKQPNEIVVIGPGTPVTSNERQESPRSKMSANDLEKEAHQNPAGQSTGAQVNDGAGAATKADDRQAEVNVKAVQSSTATGKKNPVANQNTMSKTSTSSKVTSKLAPRTGHSKRSRSRSTKPRSPGVKPSSMAPREGKGLPK